jgi:Ca2+-binding RTX toxin-like protein
MYGDFRVDKMYGVGSGDCMQGGHEFGWGDKMLGGDGLERIEINRSGDELYGGNGDDTVQGGRGNDLIQDGCGNNALYTGSAAT